jgi:hypothetical protein
VTRTNRRRVFLGVRAWLNGDRTDQNADRVVEYVVAKAIAGHFGFFKLVIDLVDGKIRQTAEEELMFERDCVLLATGDGRGAERPPGLVEAA